MIVLTTHAHSLGVAMLGKNPDDTGDSYASDMFSIFDGILTEQCNEYDSCLLSVLPKLRRDCCKSVLEIDLGHVGKGHNYLGEIEVKIAHVIPMDRGLDVGASDIGSGASAIGFPTGQRGKKMSPRRGSRVCGRCRVQRVATVSASCRRSAMPFNVHRGEAACGRRGRRPSAWARLGRAGGSTAAMMPRWLCSLKLGTAKGVGGGS
jgi:hypothetical protein